MRLGTGNRLLVVVAAALVAAVAIPYALATVVFVYQSQVTVTPVTPVVFLKGPDYKEVQLKITNNTNPQITMTLPVTNSSYVYVYQPLVISARSLPGVTSYTLYVLSCTNSTPIPATKISLYIYSTSYSSPTSPPSINLTLSNSGCSVSNGFSSLTPGTSYYVDIKVTPVLPIPPGSTGGTLTIDFGVSNGTVTSTVPP